MEGLANELVMDVAVKQAFFSTGDIFFEIARWLERTAAAREATSTARMPVNMAGSARNDGGGNSEDVRTSLVSEVRRFSAAAAVLNSAFFHSVEVPKRVNLVARSSPVSLPVVAEFLVDIFSGLRRRLTLWQHDAYGGCGEGLNDRLPQHSQVRQSMPCVGIGGW